MNKCQRIRSTRVFANPGEGSAPDGSGLRVGRALATGRTKTIV